MSEAAPKSWSDEVRRLRHDLRGQLNTMMLCSAVLAITTEQQELLQFVDEIIKAADRGVELIDEIGALPEEAFTPPPESKKS